MKYGRERDNQKQKCYDAENLAWYVFDVDVMKTLNQVDAQKYVDHIWKCNGFKNSKVKLIIRAGRIGAVAKERWIHREISCAAYCCHKPLLLHEIAHLIVGGKYGHNRVFTSKLLDLYKRFLGITESQILRLAFVEKKVKYRLNHTEK